MNVDDGNQDIRWIRGLGGERLPAASYTLFSQTRKIVYFLPSERGREYVSSVFDTTVDKCFSIRRLAGARHVLPAVL